jgi:hypothetical protein
MLFDWLAMDQQWAQLLSNQAQVGLKDNSAPFCVESPKERGGSRTPTPDDLDLAGI